MRVASRLFGVLVLSVVIGILLAGLAVPFAVLAGLGSRSVAEQLDKLPRELDVNPLPRRTQVLDRRGKVLATWYDENRRPVTLKEISPWMRRAIVAIEDSRFYDHGAIDIEGTLRALVHNQTSETTQGGSTITQQLVKLTLQQNAETEAEREAATRKTYRRKFRELRYALALENNRSKDWILQRYLNTAYFGDGAYGVETAAEHYFNRRAAKLTLRQAALLAGIVRNPTGYDPTNNRQRARQRRAVVLDRMAELGMITERRARRAAKRDLGLDLQRRPRGCVGSSAPVFCTYVRAYLLQDPAFDEVLGRSTTQRERTLRTAGLTIRTTLAPKFQRAADQSVSRHVRPTDGAVGALAMVVPGSGEVRALAQSRPIGADRKRGQTFLNYAVPKKYGNANGFQAGSTFKAFVLAAALDQGMPLTTEIRAPQELSLPVDRFRGCQGRLISNDAWEVSNSTGSGVFDLMSGTRQSVNTFFAQLELRTGLCRPYRLAKQMGVRLTDPANQQVPSFTLGVVDTNPLTMAAAYATFPARGRHCEPRPVVDIRGRDGKVAWRSQPSCRPVLPTAVADGVNHVLRGVQEPGGFGYGAGLALDQPSAGKTGTTQRGSSVWFAGYTPDLAAVSVIAGVDRRGRWTSLNGKSVGGRVVVSASGSGTAGPIWGDAMQAVQRWIPDRGFVEPPARLLRGELRTVPDVRGTDVAEASRTLREAGFGVQVLEPVRARARTEGTVVRVEPSVGTPLAEGRLVQLVPAG